MRHTIGFWLSSSYQMRVVPTQKSHVLDNSIQVETSVVDEQTFTTVPMFGDVNITLETRLANEFGMNLASLPY